ncbi:MAG: hypothetical protein KDA65_17300 [Planctomycetaceae bacterium]|nr:hypothetical protein [Planctomycetaceae bacterium]
MKLFEVVYTVNEWYDGPREGIADFNGRPHHYQSEWQDGEDMEADTFLLSPVDQKTFALALEDWDIWLKWESAFANGKTSHETHPALPEDRKRHEEIKRLLEQRLKIDPETAIRKTAEFRPSENFNSDGQRVGWLEVCWRDLE